MAHRDILKSMIADGSVETSLRPRSRKKTAVQALQSMLHALGFDAALQWKRYGADGDYGGSTTAAVQAFATRNGLEGDGQVVTAAIAKKILARYDSLDDLQHLAHAVQQGTVGQTYVRNSTDRVAVVALQTLLHDIGFDAELNWKKYGADGQYGGSTVNAVKAWAKQEAVPSDGTAVSPDLAQRIIAKLEPFYGPSWRTSPPPPSNSGDLQVREVKRGSKNRIMQECL